MDNPYPQIMNLTSMDLAGESPESASATLDAILSSGQTLVLDGGLGTHLAERGNDVTDALWSARILRDNPEEVRAAHEDFFRAGANVAISGSYQVTFDGLRQVGATNVQTEELLHTSVRLAREAAAVAPCATRLVAASIGPYGTGPGRGTEYDGDYGLTAAELATWHRPRMEILADAGADFLIAETIPSIREIEALVTLLADIAQPSVLSITVRAGQLRDGTSLSEVAAVVRGAPGIRALGVNCCSTIDALDALRVLRDTSDLPFAAYPNSGEAWDHIERRWRGSEQQLTLADAVPALVRAGARLVGGCCRVTPGDIAAIAEQLQHS